MWGGGSSVGSFSTDTSVTIGAAEEEAGAGESGHDHRERSSRLGKQGQNEESLGAHEAALQGSAGKRKREMFFSIANLRSR